MADIELLKPMPDPPLPTDPEEVFDEKAGETLTAEQYLVNIDLNTKLIPQMNLATAKVTADKNAAAQSATDAAASATAAGQQVSLAAAEVTKASAQVQLAGAARTGAETARDSAQAAAAAAGSAAGLPSLAGSANKFLGVNPAGDAVGWYDAAQQVGDILQTSRAPGATYLPASGGLYLKSAYPALAAMLGSISDLPTNTPISKTLPASATWSDVVFAGSFTQAKFVAVSRGSNVAAYSANAISWNSLPLPSAQEWAAITANNTFVVAVAANTNIIAYLTISSASPTWSQIAILPSAQSWVDACSNGTTLLALASTGSSAYGSSLSSWFAGGNMPAGTYAACAYGNGYYVSTGTATARASNPQATWAAASKPPAAPLGCLTFGGDLFVGLGSGSSNVAAVSKDGDSWDSVTLPAYGNWKSIGYGGGYYVGVSTGASPIVIYSADGYNWFIKTTALNMGRSAVAYGAETFALLPVSGQFSETWRSFNYDKTTQFVTPNVAPAAGAPIYIKAKAA